MSEHKQEDSELLETEEHVGNTPAPDSTQETPPVDSKDTYEVEDNTTAEGKTITYKLPRYEKRSFFTLMCAVFLPCMGYAIWRYYPLNEPGKLLENLLNSVLFSSYGWTLTLSSMTGGLTPGTFKKGLIICCVIQIGLVIFLRKYEKWTPKKAFTIAICIGMGSLFLINLMEAILYRNQNLLVP